MGDRARCRCPRATTSSLSLVSATVARTVLSTVVTIGKEQVRWFLVAAYALSWFIVMVSDHSNGPFSWFIMKLRDMSFWFPVIVSPRASLSRTGVAGGPATEREQERARRDGRLFETNPPSPCVPCGHAGRDIRVDRFGSSWVTEHRQDSAGYAFLVHCGGLWY